MSPPYLRGDDVGWAIRRVQWTVRSRGLRQPASSIDRYSDCAGTLIDHIAQGNRSLRDLAECSTLLRALTSYYDEVGSQSDARRWEDLRCLVDMVADRISRRDGASSDFGVGAVWDAVFRQVFLARSRLPPGASS